MQIRPVAQGQDESPVKIKHNCDISKSLKCSTSNSNLPYEQQRTKIIHRISCYEILRFLQLLSLEFLHTFIGEMQL